MLIGDRIRSVRKKKNLTQGELAVLAGCSQQTIVDIEGKRNEKSRYFLSIAKALEVSAEYLETGVGSNLMPSADMLLPQVDFRTVAEAALNPDHDFGAIDHLYRAPIPMSQGSFTVAVDREVVQLFPNIPADSILFVDPAVASTNHGRALVLMDGWRKAEVRTLTFIGEACYLDVHSDRFSNKPLEVTLYTNLTDYLANIDSPVRPAALMCGYIVFIGKDL